MKGDVKKMARITVRNEYELWPVRNPRLGHKQAYKEAEKCLARKAKALIGDVTTPCFMDPETVRETLPAEDRTADPTSIML